MAASNNTFDNNRYPNQNLSMPPTTQTNLSSNPILNQPIQPNGPKEIGYDWFGDSNHQSPTNINDGNNNQNLFGMDFLGKNLYLENIFSAENVTDQEEQENTALVEEEWIVEDNLEIKEELQDAEKLYL
jgi:hypothetical protein